MSVERPARRRPPGNAVTPERPERRRASDWRQDHVRDQQAAVQRRRFRTVVLAHWVAQFVLATIGLIAAIGGATAWLLAWNVIATLYAVTAVIAMETLSRRPPAEYDIDDQPRPWLLGSRPTAVLLLTGVPAVLGVTAAVSVIFIGPARDETDAVLKLLGVWTMLLAWAFVHWGFAQVYLLHDRRNRPVETFDFPRTPRPGIVDFVYFSFTLGTTFAASDVTALTTRTRWIITLHSVMSFLMNALIIALAFDTIKAAAS